MAVTGKLKVGMGALALVAAMLGGVKPAHATHSGRIVFGAHLSIKRLSVYPVSSRLHVHSTKYYAADLARPARQPWLLLTLNRVVYGSATQLVSRDWMDADEGDTRFADALPMQRLFPGTYTLSIRQDGRTLASGAFAVVR